MGTDIFDIYYLWYFDEYHICWYLLHLYDSSGGMGQDWLGSFQIYALRPTEGDNSHKVWHKYKCKYKHKYKCKFNFFSFLKQGDDSHKIKRKWSSPRKWLKFSQHHHHLQNPLILGEDHCLLYHLLLLLGYLLDNLSFHIRLGEVLYPTIFQFVCNYSQKVLEFDFRPYPSCIQTLPYTFDGPKWQMESGLIGSQPGVSRNSKIMLENGKTKNQKSSKMLTKWNLDSLALSQGWGL